MSATSSNRPLRLNAPGVIVSPPTPTSPNAYSSIPRAPTSRKIAISPIILIPGHSPLTTTLTPQQLTDFLPTLHIFLEPRHSLLFLLPAAGISPTGLESALRWREAEFAHPSQGIATDLPELITIYQALSFLRHDSTSHALHVLRKTIEAQIEEGLSLDEYRAIWALRHLPFTDLFIKAMVRRLVETDEELAVVVRSPGFRARLEGDEGLGEMVEATMRILKWVCGERELSVKVERMKADMEAQEKRRARGRGRGRSSGSRSALGEFRSSLETVFE